LLKLFLLHFSSPLCVYVLLNMFYYLKTYVAGMNQLSTSMRSDISWKGTFYVSALTLCMFDAWKTKTLHDSTFCASDFSHKLFDVLYICSVSSAALFISPIYLMKDMSRARLFGFILSISVNSGDITSILHFYSALGF
jgi:hypothetical protein